MIWWIIGIVIFGIIYPVLAEYFDNKEMDKKE